MQTLDPARLREGNSSSRPPYFDGTNYAHWKVRMKFYIRAQNRFLWDAIESGYTPPDKPLKEYTAEEIKIELSNDQAMNHLFCALSENEFNRVSACQTAKEVWEKLGVHYEGTMQVKKTKLRILEEHYETFRVGSDEDIATAITRFTKLLNEIKNLGKNYDQETSVYKFLRGLPKEWDAKKYAIQSAQNLGDYTFDALCGELTVHEFELKDRARLEALSGGTKSSRKDIALKANSSPSASVEIIENEKSCDDNDLEEKVAMLSRKLNRAMYKRDKYKKKFRSGSKGGKSNETICFGCGKPGHIKADCKSKKVFDKKKGKKSFKATWDDSSSSSSESESESEKAILCLMAKGEDARKSTPWYLDSGCSRHMTEDAHQFIELKRHDGGKVTFGDNNKGRVIGLGTVGNNSLSISNVYLVDGLKHNLLKSISQLCDKGFHVMFESSKCFVRNEKHETLFIAYRDKNVYSINFDEMNMQNVSCLSAQSECDAWLWHRRLGHSSMENLSKLTKHDLVKGLPKCTFKKDKECEPCILGKQVKSSFKTKVTSDVTRALELIHMDLFGPTQTQSLGGKSYCFVIVDDFTRYTWVYFLSHKHEVFDVFVKFCALVENEKGYKITIIRSDRGGEFVNRNLEDFCAKQGYTHQLSSPRTPQQNGVVERKNRTLQEMCRTMLNEYNIAKHFWAEAINTACYVINKVNVRKHEKDSL
ncbi:hypothetical protein Syun_004198 [Stephania yunnanensis]|uniref:Retrovirus-related Pol polyprotein from transposon TNT 1-94 n=1 Tax=Stephania yunnanensis TaxID=152371 RepID=A0AAP0L2P4_9MAGN